jgi:hypothetical protein
MALFKPLTRSGVSANVPVIGSQAGVDASAFYFLDGSIHMVTQSAPTDQQNVSQPMMVNGTTGPIDVTALKTAAGSANVYKFTKDFTFAFNHSVCSYRHGGIYALHADLKAALLAASAPMTQL